MVSSYKVEEYRSRQTKTESNDMSWVPFELHVSQNAATPIENSTIQSCGDIQSIQISAFAVQCM